MNKITYANKVDTRTTTDPEINKVTASTLNEVKTIVNETVDQVALNLNELSNNVVKTNSKSNSGDQSIAGNLLLTRTESNINLNATGKSVEILAKSTETSADPAFRVRQDDIIKVDFGWDDDGTSDAFAWNYSNGGFKIGVNNLLAFKILADLSATFASSVSAGAGIFSGDVNINDSKLQITDATPQIILSVPSGGLDSRIYNDGAGNFIIAHGTNSATPPTALTIAIDLSATFASSVSATDGTFSGIMRSAAIRSNRSDGEIYIQAASSSDFVSIGTEDRNNLLKVNGNGNVNINYGNLDVTDGSVSATKFIEEYTVLEPTGDFTLSNSSHYINYTGSASGDITIPSGLDKQVWEITVSAFNATFVAGTGVTIVVIQNEQTLSNNVAYKHSAKLIHKGLNKYLLIKY